jgi:hypothetical protein
MHRFDPAEWRSSRVASTDVLRGSYPIEGHGRARYAWVGGEARIALAAKEAGDLRVRGYVPLDLHRRAGAEAVTISLFVNERRVRSLVAEGDGRIDIRVTARELPGAVGDEFLDVRIAVSHVVRPREVGVGPDARALGMVVSFIGLE